MLLSKRFGSQKGLVVARWSACLLLLIELLAAQATPPIPAPQSSTTPAPALPVPPPHPRPAVIIDAAHGGSESGAVLSPTILEKDVTLSFSRRLRQDLTSKGILTELLRDADVNLSTDDRAARVNSDHPELYVCLHASSEIGPTKIFSAMMPPSAESQGPFMDWNTAQSASLATSRRIQQELVAVLQKRGVTAQALIAPLRPLNNVITPAIAVELAPTRADVSQLNSLEYQQTISAALADSIAGLISSLPSNSEVPQ